MEQSFRRLTVETLRNLPLREMLMLFSFTSWPNTCLRQYLDMHGNTAFSWKKLKRCRICSHCRGHWGNRKLLLALWSLPDVAAAIKRAKLIWPRLRELSRVLLRPWIHFVCVIEFLISKYIFIFNQGCLFSIQNYQLHFLMQTLCCNNTFKSMTAE